MAEASEPPDVVDLEGTVVPDGAARADRVVESSEIRGLDSSEIDPECSSAADREETGALEEGVGVIGSDSEDRHVREVGGGPLPQDSSVDADANTQEADCEHQVPPVGTNQDHQEVDTKSKAIHDDVNSGCPADLIIAKAPFSEDPVVEVEHQEMDQEMEVSDVHLADVGQDCSHEGSLVQPQVMQRESEVGRECKKDSNHDEDKETSLLKMHALVANKSTVDGDKSLDSITVGGIIYHQTDCVLEDTNLDDLAVKSQSEVRNTQIDGDSRLALNGDEGKDNEAHTFHTSLVDNDENNREESVTVSDSAPAEADHFTKDPDHVDLAMKPEMLAGSDVDGDQERESEASAPRSSLLETNQYIQEEGSTMFSADVSEAVGHQTDSVAEDKNMIATEGIITTSNELTSLSAAEAENVDTNSVIGVPPGSGCSLMSRVHLAQNIAELPALNPDPHPFHGNTMIEGDITKVGFEYGVDVNYDEDQEASVSKMHPVDNTQEGDTLLGSDSDNINCQADCAPQDPDLPDPSVELQAKMKCIGSDGFVQTSLMATNQNVLEENDSLLDSVPLESHHLMNDPNQITPSIEVKPAIVGGEAEMYDGAEMDVDQDTDRETALKASVVETNQNIVGEEADNGDVNSVNDGPLGSIYPIVTDVRLAQNIVDLAAQSADIHSLNENVVVQGDITNAEASIVSELQSHGIQLIDENPNDKEDITELISCSIGETEDDGTCSLGEKLMVTQDTILQISNSVVESSTLAETQTVLSQGKDSVSLPYDNNQDIEAQSVGTLVDGDLGAKSPELSLGKSQYTFTDSEVIKNDTPPPITCCKNVESNQVSETKHETGSPSSTSNMTGVPTDEGADDKQNIQVGKGELLKETEEQLVQSEPSSTGVSVMENKQHISYHLPSLDQAKFSISDLVWGKVKSHPWWPGQIIDPSDASQLALKYQKKDNFLIAYFGDKTFAWCDESQLKPFCSYFSQMEKQCSSDSFVTGVNDILAEMSRRVELGMTCSCLPEETCANIKFQKVDNAGVRRGNVTSNLDRPLILNYFQPGGLLEYIKTLAQFPNGSVDRLELAIAKSQLKAFYCSKGYPELHAFTVDRGLIEDVAMISPSDGKVSGEDGAKHSNPAISDLVVGKGKLRSIDNSIKKRKHVLEVDKKQKDASDLTHEEDSLHLQDDGLENSEKLISSSVVKHTTFGSDSLDSGRHKKRTLDFFGDTEPTSPPPTLTSSFKIGEFIRRAASQLTGAPPFVKCQQETNPKSILNDHNRGDVTDFDVLPQAPEENKRGKTSLSESNSAPYEMLSQLCLAASDPMNSNYFVPTMVAFFTSFRNSRASCTSEGNKQVEKRKRGRPRKVIPQPLFSELFSDISSSEDKHIEKQKRGMPKKLDSQPAISDVSSSEGKPHNEKCSSQEHVEKRKRGRPKKIISTGQLKTSPHSKKKVLSLPAISDICSSGEKKHVEKRKRGRPKKVIPQLASFDVSTPDHTQDSYWSDTTLQKRLRKSSFSDDRNWKVETHTDIQQKRKSAAQQSLSPSSGSMMENEHLQIVAMNSDKKHSFVAERPIINVEEKIVKECTPTALILNFSSSTTLPSVTDLIRIFSPYGPLKEAETDFLRKTNCVKVVFKRRADAEAAFSGAGKYCIFGPGLLSYQLKCMPWTPKSAQQTNPQVQHDAASTASEQQNHSTTSIVATQANYNPVATQQDNQPHEHDESPIMTTPQDNHDPTLVSRPPDDSAPISTIQKEGHMQDCNIEISEVAECVIASDTIMVEAEADELPPDDKYDSTSVPLPEDDHDATPINLPQDIYDATPITASQDKCDATPITSQDDQDATPITRTQDEHDATQIERSNLPQAMLVIVTSQESQDATLNNASQDCQDTVPTTTSQENYNAPQELAETLVASGPELIEPEAEELSSQDKYDSIFKPEDNHDSSSIATTQDIHGSTPINTSGDNHDAATFTTPQDYPNTAPIIRPQDGYDATQIDSSNLSQDKHDAVLITKHCFYNDAELIVTHQDSQDATVNTAPQDYQDTIPTTTQENYGATQEVAETVIASDPELVEAEAVELSPQEKYDWTFTPQPEDNHDASSIAAPQNKHDSTPITTSGDYHDASLFTASQDYQDAAPEDKYDATQIESSNLPQDNPDAMLITETWVYHDATPIAAPQDSQDATLVPQDYKSESPTTTLQENYDARQEQSEIMEVDTTQSEEGIESSQ